MKGVGRIYQQTYVDTFRAHAICKLYDRRTALVAADLLNLKLSERLRQAREMEAFQTVAAFFVHDLKNLASKLSMMLENLPNHFDNPGFRDDAMQMMTSTA